MSLDHAAALLRDGDPDRFLAAMAAPPAFRGRLVALYAFNLEVARAPVAAREPLVGLMRLAFWEEAVAEIARGLPPRRHPVLAALAPVLGEAGLDPAPLAALVAARRRDATGEAPADMAALDAYLAATSAGLMALAARALGAPADAAAAGLGHAMGAANLLRALPALALRGRLPLPGLGPADRAALAEGRTTPALREAVRAVATRALDRHAEGLALARSAPAAARPALRAAWRAGPLLRAAARPGVDVLRDLGPESEARRRLSLLLRVLLGRV